MLKLLAHIWGKHSTTESIPNTPTWVYRWSGYLLIAINSGHRTDETQNVQTYYCVEQKSG